MFDTCPSLYFLSLPPVHRSRLVQLQHRKSCQIGISSGKAHVSVVVVVVNDYCGQEIRQTWD